ncbi:MAG: MoxR family ATPase [Phycisphaeraceae bacterium]|jgi:MoxR-like ATPase|nr:MoxR family ATPase [Phycisphaeraceae bacterium]
MTPEQIQARAGQFRADFDALGTQLARVIVGQQEIIQGVLTALFCNGHTLLEGVPGIGKTLLIRTLSRALNLSFSRVQFTPDLMPADITGTTIVLETDRPDGSRARQFTFQPGPIFAQMVLADEINRATPKTQSALLEAMAERSVTVAGTTHALEKPFFVMATQNPLEQEGTYPLPEAQLDRFFVKLLVGYSSRKDLAEVLARTTGDQSTPVEAVLDAPRLIEHQNLVRQVAIAEHVRDYAVRLTLSTHARNAGLDSAGEFATPMVNKYVRVGASPRAAQALVLGAKCRALVDGRAAASMADIQWMARPVLRHRLLLNFEAQADATTPDAIIDNILATLPQGVVA